MLWQLVLHCFHHSDPALRKRAAFILQTIPLHKPQLLQHPQHYRSPDTISPHAVNAIGENTLQSKSSNRKCTVPTTPPSFSSGHKNRSVSNTKLWWGDFLDIYHQAEGCSSLHLVNQVGLLVTCTAYFSSKL